MRRREKKVVLTTFLSSQHKNFYIKYENLFFKRDRTKNILLPFFGMFSKENHTKLV